ncbi:MAG: hypothetical protein K2M00_08850 [Muribaculaceae bacterium]|nr:hypothetical protein [Muribaculaceae bacterium]
MTSNHLTSNDIKQLLDKFYAGETTPAEEALLTQYFLSHSDDDGLEEDRRLFIALARARQGMPPVDLEDRIVAATCGRRRLFTPARAAAATVIVLIAAAAAIFLPGHDTDGSNLNDEGILTALVNHPDTILNPDTVQQNVPAQPVEVSTARASRARERKPEAIAQATPVSPGDSARIAAAGDLLERMLSGSFTAMNSGMNQAVETVKAVDKTVNQIIK